MLSRTEWVWRHLLVAAFAGQRRHRLTTLAEVLGLPKTTVHAALGRPRAIGVVESSHAGIRVLDPERLLLLWAGNRDLTKDVVHETRTEASPRDVEDALAPEFILGGFAAYLAEAGQNRVADYDTVLAYGPIEAAARAFPCRRTGSTRVLILEPDPLLPSYGRQTSRPQTYVDIFNLPGWQAARFYLDLTRRLFADEAA